jgi:hypothetical protein
MSRLPPDHRAEVMAAWARTRRASAAVHENSKFWELRAVDLTPQRLRRTDEVVAEIVQCGESGYDELVTET